MSPPVLSFGDGLGVALVTPFRADGALDEPALLRLVDHVVSGGADFLVGLGSTGEAGLLEAAERARVIELLVAHRRGLPLVVGIAGSSTAEAVRRAREALAAGVDGLLVAAPAYVKPTRDGVVAHFEAVAAAVPSLPLIAYNVPSRNAVHLDAEVVQRLWRLPQVVALKESSGDLMHISRVAAALPEGRCLLAGDDALTLPIVAIGGCGVVSVAGNVLPGAMRELLLAARAGDLETARFLNNRLQPWFDALSAEPNPVPVKAALESSGLPCGAPRLPLLPAAEATRRRLGATLPVHHEVLTHG